MGAIMQRRQRGTRIGFVGLGSIGGPLAGRLLYRNQVFGTNRTRSKAAALIRRGLIWRDSPREVAEAADVVFSVVADDAALAAVTAGPDGILAGLRPGALYVEMSTVSPGASRELSRRVGLAGATMVDAPVSGGVAAAETGTLAIMVGGTEAGYRAAEALLLRLGSTVTHVGGNGQGLLLDLAINISAAAQMLAFHEGAMLAANGGIDPTVTARAMTEFAGGPTAAHSPLPLVLDPPRRARCDVAQMHKGLRLALETAHASGLQLPVAAAVQSALSPVKDGGHAHRHITGPYRGEGASRL
jgi:3-hydroxyisobutyrate dehydrogenase-like beta-hydroxyacid dehydrogenase